MPEKSTLYL